MGPTPWQLYDAENHFLDEMSLNKVEPSKIAKTHREAVLPWALYTLNGGSQHKYAVKSESGRWVFENKNIFIDFKSWAKKHLNGLSV